MLIIIPFLCIMQKIIYYQHFLEVTTPFFFGVGRSFFFILCFIQGFSPSLNVTENCCLFRRSLAKVKQNQKLYPLLLIVISSFFAPIS